MSLPSTRAERRAHCRKRLPFLGKLVYFTLAARIHMDGNGDPAGAVLRWWNPLAWVIAGLVLVIVLLLHGIHGVREVLETELRFSLPRFYREHPERVEWL